MLFSVRYNSASGKGSVFADGVPVFPIDEVAEVSFTRSKDSDQFFLRVVGPDGTVKEFGEASAAVAGEQEVKVDEQLTSDILEYFHPGQGDEE